MLRIQGRIIANWVKIIDIEIPEYVIMKRMFKLLLIGLMCVSITSCKIKKQLKDDIYIFYTSDVHCGIDENLTMSSLKALINDTKAEHPYVSLVDLGDYVQGGEFGALSKGEIIIKVMNKIGYDFVTFGNHEFDYGMEQLSKLISIMEFQPILANVRYTGNKENIFKDVPEYVIKDYDGTKVAFIGVDTPACITSATPAFFKEDGEFVYDFYSGDDGLELAEKVQSVVDEVRKKGADYVVAMTHLGASDSNVPYDSISFIHNTNGIDVVLDGHAHLLIVEDKYPNKDGEDVILSSVGTKLQAAGELIIGKDGSLTTMHVDSYDKKDGEINQVIEEAQSELDVILDQEIFTIDHTIWMSDEEGVRMSRNRETPAGNFLADAYGKIMDAQIGLANGGGIRAAIPEGTVTYQNLLDVNPFMNELVCIEATGQQIFDALEYNSSEVQRIYKLDGAPVGETGGFLSVSGLKYTIDTSIDSAVTVDENGLFAGYSSDARRVKDVYVLIDGEYEPLDLEKTYTLASNDYVILNNGNGLTAFDGCQIVSRGVTDINALIEYAQSIDDYTDLYKDVEGRITVE